MTIVKFIFIFTLTLKVFVECRWVKISFYKIAPCKWGVVGILWIWFITLFHSIPISIQHNMYILRPFSFSISILSHLLRDCAKKNAIKLSTSSTIYTRPKEHSISFDGWRWRALIYTWGFRVKLSTKPLYLPGLAHSLSHSFSLFSLPSNQWLIDKTQDDTWSSIMIRSYSE